MCVPVEDGADVARLRAERVAMVYDAAYDGVAGRPSGLAEVLGLSLGVPSRALGARLHTDRVRVQEPETMQVLRDVADLHRGETVVVLLDGNDQLELRIDGDGVAFGPTA